MLYEMWNVFNMRSERKSLFSLRQNWWLWIAVLGSVSLQIALVTIPQFGGLFGATPLGLSEWLIVGIVGASVLVTGEIFKVVWRARA